MNRKRLLSSLLLVCLLGMLVPLCIACEQNKKSDTATDGDTETTAENRPQSQTETTAATQTGEGTEKETEEETEAETERAMAGINPDLTRDGTPKKYFTLSFDDGITQDLEIIKILKKHNVTCCTFNINTGLYGANWEWVGRDALKMPEVTHLRFTEEELRTGIYNGYDVEVHTLTHPSLSSYDRNKGRLQKEVQNDAENIYNLTGIMPVGMAWPGGDGQYTEKTIQNVLELTTIRFARGTTSTYSFALPEYFLQWQPTCSITDGSVMTLAERFVEAECTENMLFYVWGHGYELEAYNLYDRLDTLIGKMKEADDIVLVTNAEFYQLFKDQIPAWKEGQ